MKIRKISIVGTKGLPANYGGFETFTDFFCRNVNCFNVLVYCDNSTDLDEKYEYCLRCRFPLSANGIQGILYDSLCILHSIIVRRDILLLGSSGAFFIPIARCFGIKVVTNIAGLEWSRSKWSFIARKALKLFEAIAVKFSNVVIADNHVIKKYITETYKVDSTMIAYGGDQVLDYEHTPINVPYEKYYFSMARCQPDNNIEMILDSFVESGLNIIFVSNWSVNSFGKYINNKYASIGNICLMDAIYDVGKTNYLRSNSLAYIHGHSAGGTNPVLVESMFLGCPCVCFDNKFNNFTTFDKAFYFYSSKDLTNILTKIKEKDLLDSSRALKNLANKHYTWERICKSYSEILSNV